MTGMYIVIYITRSHQCTLMKVHVHLRFPILKFKRTCWSNQYNSCLVSSKSPVLYALYSDSLYSILLSSSLLLSSSPLSSVLSTLLSRSCLFYLRFNFVFSFTLLSLLVTLFSLFFPFFFSFSSPVSLFSLCVSLFLSLSIYVLFANVCGLVLCNDTAGAKAI